MIQSLTQFAQVLLQSQSRLLQVLAMVYTALALAAWLLCLGGLAVCLLSGRGVRRQARTTIGAPAARATLPAAAPGAGS